MAVVSVKEKHQRRRSSNKAGKLSHTRSFIVVTDNITDGTAAALTAEGIPADGDPLSEAEDNICFVTSIEAEPIDDDDLHFEVTVEYTSADSGGLTVIDNPLERPPEVSWSSNEATAPYFLDCSNPPKRVTNTAGEAFENFLERETGELQISISINEASFDVVVAETFKHTTNDGPVIIDGTTFPEGTLKLSPITASKVRERVETDGVAEVVTYYKKQYNLKARAEGWKDKPLDVGLNERVGDEQKGYQLKPILDYTHQPVRKAWPLDGAGRPTNGSTTAEPITLEFKPYKETSWASFPWNNAEVWAA